MTDAIYEGNRLCGYYNPENKCYVSRRVSSKHYYVMGGGYPISNDILKRLKSKGCEGVVIIEVKSDNTERSFKASLQQYEEAVLIESGGFEQQRCLPLKQMKETK